MAAYDADIAHHQHEDDVEHHERQNDGRALECVRDRLRDLASFLDWASHVASVRRTGRALARSARRRDLRRNALVAAPAASAAPAIAGLAGLAAAVAAPGCRWRAAGARDRWPIASWCSRARRMEARSMACRDRV